jgi:hypothetical protein
MVDKLHPGSPLTSIIEIHDKKYHQHAATPSETDFKVPNNFSTNRSESLAAIRKEITNDTKNRTNYNNKSG